MILKRENVEIHTDDAREIEELKRVGYSEVKTDDRKPKRKRTRKAGKSDGKQ